MAKAHRKEVRTLKEKIKSDKAMYDTLSKQNENNLSQFKEVHKKQAARIDELVKQVNNLSKKDEGIVTRNRATNVPIINTNRNKKRPLL